MQASYSAFVSSHYDPQSGEAFFVSSGGDDGDESFPLDDNDSDTAPLISGFADDEPLIVA